MSRRIVRSGFGPGLPIAEVPLSLPLGDTSSSELWPWRVNCNVQGDRLRSGERRYGWGFGVHADNMLRFALPRFATGFGTEVRLDRLVGGGGCARATVRLRTGENVRELFRSSLLIGSMAVQDTGTLRFVPFDGAAWLELVADSAGHEHAPGADPLDIRDMVDWLEPRLLLDSEGLSIAVAQAAARLDPALRERSGVFDQHGTSLKK